MSRDGICGNILFYQNGMGLAVIESMRKLVPISWILACNLIPKKLNYFWNADFSLGPLVHEEQGELSA